MLIGIALVLVIAKAVDHFFLDDRYLCRKIYVPVMAESIDNSGLACVKAKAAFKRPQPAENSRIRRELENLIASQPRKTVIYTNDGHRLEGEIISRNNGQVRFKSSFGSSGNMMTSLKESDIDRIEESIPDTSPATDAEVRLKSWFPSFSFSRQGPYSFFTDDGYFRIIDSVSELKNLRNQFEAVFARIIDVRRAKRSNVLIFARPDDYRAFRDKNASEIRFAVGYYSPKGGYLTFYNFFEDTTYKETENYTAQERRKMDELRKAGLSDYGKKWVSGHEREVTSRLTRQAANTRAKNIRILRHEGSHQLSYDLNLFGVNTEDWLSEGLAQYCETPYIGELDLDIIESLRQAAGQKRLFKPADMFDDDNTRRIALLASDKIDLFYAQSWAMFYLLMQDECRQEMFSYLVAMKTRPFTKQERIALLERELGFSLDELQDKVIVFINTGRAA